MSRTSHQLFHIQPVSKKDHARELEHQILLSDKDSKNPFTEIQKETESEFFQAEKLSFWKFASFCIQEGLPASICYGDYFICALVIRMLLSSNPNNNLTAATGFTQSFYAIFNTVVTFGVIENQGIEGSKANGAGKYKIVNQKLRQGLVIGIGFFFLFTIQPFWFLSWLLTNLFQVPEPMMEDTIQMIYWTLPSIFVRVLADNLKTFLLNLGFLKKTGWVMGFNLIPFSIVAYLLLWVLNLGSFGVGLSMLFYELSSIVTLYWRIYSIDVEDQYKDTSVPISEGFGRYFGQTVKIVFSEFPSFFLWASVQFILGLSEDVEELTAYSLAYCLILISWSINVSNITIS